MENIDLNRSILYLQLSVKAENILMRHGIKTIADLSKMSRGELAEVRGIKRKEYDEVIEKLQNLGIFLESEDD